MIACYSCRGPLTRRLYWNSPNAPVVAEEASMFSAVPGPRAVCPACAERLDALDGKGKHLLRKFHAHEDGVGDRKRMVPSPAEMMAA